MPAPRTPLAWRTQTQARNHRRVRPSRSLCPWGLGAGSSRFPPSTHPFCPAPPFSCFSQPGSPPPSPGAGNLTGRFCPSSVPTQASRWASPGLQRPDETAPTACSPWSPPLPTAVDRNYAGLPAGDPRHHRLDPSLAPPWSCQPAGPGPSCWLWASVHGGDGQRKGTPSYSCHGGCSARFQKHLQRLLTEYPEMWEQAWGEAQPAQQRPPQIRGLG